MKIELFKWERIFSNDYNDTYRAEVLGGWIVRHERIFNITDDSSGETLAMVFIPDPNHEW